MCIRTLRIDGGESEPVAVRVPGREPCTQRPKGDGGGLSDRGGGPPLEEEPGLRRWWSRALRMGRAAWSLGPSKGRARFEEALLRFSRGLDGMQDRADVEAGLIRLAGELVPRDQVALDGMADLAAGRPGRGSSRGSSPGLAGDPLVDARGGRRDVTMIEIPLRCGRAVHGRLKIAKTRGRSGLSTAVQRRLELACTMAACALETLHQNADWGWHDGEEPAEDVRSRASETRPAGVIRDATFLNAVFPFALGQARRHREPIALLCLAIDRLGAIQDLLGPEVVDRLVQEVCQVVASSIRSSDIVARLDDDRIIVMLIRARARNAVYVAEKISRSVAEKTRNAAALGCATVSIGVAEFPGDAHTAHALLDAADEALARAQGGGRNQIVVAEARRISPTASALAVPSAASPY